MKRKCLLRRIWNWLPPQTWAEIFAAIAALLLAFLALTFLLDCLKGALP